MRYAVNVSRVSCEMTYKNISHCFRVSNKADDFIY